MESKKQAKSAIAAALLVFLSVAGGVYAASPLISQLFTSSPVTFIEEPEVPVALSVSVTTVSTPTYVGDPCEFGVMMTNPNEKTTLVNISIEVCIYGTTDPSAITLTYLNRTEGLSNDIVPLSVSGDHLSAVVYGRWQSIAPGASASESFAFTSSVAGTFSYTVQVTSYPAE